MKRHLYCTGKYILIYLIGFLVFYVVDGVVLHIAFPVLNNFFPDVFIHYNPVFEKAEYQNNLRELSFYAALITVFILNVLDVTYDNTRLELIIKETDGFYKIWDGLGIYLAGFLSVDIVSAAVIPAIFVPLTLITLPEKLRALQGILDTPLMLTSAVTGRAGELAAYFLIFAVGILGRGVGVFTGLKRWRGLWLSDIGSEV